MLELTKQTKRLEQQLCELEILLDAERQATAQRIEGLERQLKEVRAALADAELSADLDCMDREGCD